MKDTRGQLKLGRPASSRANVIREAIASELNGNIESGKGPTNLGELMKEASAKKSYRKVLKAKFFEVEDIKGQDIRNAINGDVFGKEYPHLRAPESNEMASDSRRDNDVVLVESRADANQRSNGGMLVQEILTGMSRGAPGANMAITLNLIQGDNVNVQGDNVQGNQNITTTSTIIDEAMLQSVQKAAEKGAREGAEDAIAKSVEQSHGYGAVSQPA
mmetsp:Transcript_39175/g.71772  ORF Transcript_39175/g.71772 Transcript_39175/m.71772 type:complete len:217 (-) Transcript_39175:247-897(-)|eukprot:CAMPEP_0201965288 /NCGR_PEP_ID=MMETSP0904-20121228/10630_1 /ASSEMBLY_ACC=CAM_ASM_000553 /TAXON_ID=420261 /ORGANISM="Thalassiosira antarctica, Strain CCMP982" /LENGTH=216 /DNA_ID=CAMNT_0048512317 /DNA_START=398 /DNA_END=1048 /DNA_ORIENTATION=+